MSLKSHYAVSNTLVGINSPLALRYRSLTHYVLRGLYVFENARKKYTPAGKLVSAALINLCGALKSTSTMALNASLHIAAIDKACWQSWFSKWTSVCTFTNSRTLRLHTGSFGSLSHQTSDDFSFIHIHAIDSMGVCWNFAFFVRATTA